MAQPPSHSSRYSSIPALHLLLLLGAATCFFFAGLGHLPLLEPDEGRNAEVAREMLASGDWITPHYDTLPYLDKPAVFFWLVAGSYRAFGISEWAARFPSALMALGTMFMVWVLGRRMFGDSIGLRAGLVFASSPLALGLARIVIFDMTLAFFVVLAMLSFRMAEDCDFQRRGPDLVFFAAMGIATIIKGPVGFLLPLLSILVYEGVRGEIREMKRLRWGLGLVVFLVVALPWFVAVSMRNPGFPRYAFWQESILRFATGHAHRSGSLFYYFPVYFAGFFPWSLVLFFAALNRWRSWKSLRQEQHRATLFLLSWAAVVFVFFSISRSKLPVYFLPALIPLSMLVAHVWSELDLAGTVRVDWLTGGFAALMLFGFLIAVLSQSTHYGLNWTRLTKNIPPSAAELLSGTLLYSGLILVALGVLGRMVTRRRGKAWQWVAFNLLALATPLLTLRWIQALRLYAERTSSRRLAEIILASPERDLPIYGYYYFRTGLGFYLQRQIGLVTEDGDELTSNYIVSLLARGAHSLPSLPPAMVIQRGRSPGESAPLLVDAQGLKNLAETSSQPFLVMARNDEVGGLAETVGRLEPFWSEWQYSVWKIPGRKN
jgi:4-amino-4-deoxy-L-arabinose transferase-like glycosyltransferase